MAIKDIFLTGELFEKVQMENIFPDCKTFVDCTPRFSLSDIMGSYESEKTLKGFNLSSFVNRNFALPETPFSNFQSKPGMNLEAHLNQLWDVLTREPKETTDSLIRLPHSYVVPGGRFREIYYWDSYFTMLGLQISGRIDLIENMVDNFAFLIDHVGYIPNGNRTYYLGRSQPPFFACMVRLLSEEKGDNILRKYRPQLLKEYEFWMKGKDELSTKQISRHRLALMPDGSCLNHYWDENDTPRPESYREDVELAKHSSDKNILYRDLRAAAESGWDFSSRWFRKGEDFSTIHTTEIIPVDLNCLLYNLEMTLADAYSKSGENEGAGEFAKRAESRKRSVIKYCWSDSQKAFVDYDYTSGEKLSTLSLAMAFPLFFDIATPAEADSAAILLETRFLNPGGLITTTQHTHQQWDAPNGWAPLQWIAVKGLMNYGKTSLASEIGNRWMKINEQVYHNTGKMMEKYNVMKTDLLAGGGEYPAQDGFGWTNGVYLAMKDLFTAS
jgi:alpha,alpha-trehalase